MQGTAQLLALFWCICFWHLPCSMFTNQASAESATRPCMQLPCKCPEYDVVCQVSASAWPHQLWIAAGPRFQRHCHRRQRDLPGPHRRCSYHACWHAGHHVQLRRKLANPFPHGAAAHIGSACPSLAAMPAAASDAKVLINSQGTGGIWPHLLSKHGRGSVGLGQVASHCSADACPFQCSSDSHVQVTYSALVGHSRLISQS